jgi:hypothetical protein
LPEPFESGGVVVVITPHPLGVLGRIGIGDHGRAARSVSTVISLGAKTRNGGPQKPVPRLV